MTAGEGARIITFYSYKGGTGRSMALANVAWILASNGKRVLVIDWDLEAPGVHRYFHPFLIDKDLRNSPGLIDLMWDFASAAMIRQDSPDQTQDWQAEYTKILRYAVAIEWEFERQGSLHLVAAGRQDASYASRVDAFSWQNFYDRLQGGVFLERLKASLRSEYDYVLIDSRTGLSDTAGICTVQMPDILVDCFTLSTQSIDGAAAVAESVCSQRTNAEFRLLPVPMRVEDGEHKKLEAGRAYARSKFDQFLGHLEPADKDLYWGEVEVPYRLFYSYEEILSTIGDRPTQEGTILAAMERLTARLSLGAVTNLVPETEIKRRQLLAEFERGAEPAAYRDFFISYVQSDVAWAEWIAWQLEEAGFTTALQAWDFSPGQNFVTSMREALGSVERVIAVFSHSYLASSYATDEWAAAFVAGEGRVGGGLVPVLVEDVQLPRLLRPIVHLSFVGLDETACRRVLVDGLSAGRTRPLAGRPPASVMQPADRRKPTQAPVFPVARLSNLPPRNPRFTGRADLLQQLHDALAEAGTAAITMRVVSGLDGVGKTQLAIEYAHRYTGDYDLVWWIPAEQPTVVATALGELARLLGIGEQVDQREMVSALFAELRARDRWLLIYDNAERPQELEAWLPPAGSGHVLVTSRWSSWGRQALPLRLDVLSRDESVAFLARRTGSSDLATLDALAEQLGDLPLALEEAAAYLEETGIGLEDYLDLVRDRARELFGLDQPISGEHRDERRVATTWAVSLERVHQEAPAAEALLSLCAFLAPDIPRELPTEQPEVLPGALAQAVRDPLVYNRILAVVGRYSLVTVSPTTIGVHRLVQAVIRARLGGTEERRWAEVAVELLRASFPNESWEVATWPTCERLLPHALAVTGHAERLGVAGAQAGWLLDRSSAYLRERGHYRQAKPIAERGLAITEAALGPFDLEVAWRRDELSRVLLGLGELPGAREQADGAVAIAEAALGPDHPEVALMRDNLGVVLQATGDAAGAKTQFERALTIGEAAYGPEHPEVAVRRNNLGTLLFDLGDPDSARQQLERALAIREAAYGPNHPSVATSLDNLGVVLQALGDLDGARRHLERALAIREAALGPNHPSVATSLDNLGMVLRDMGDLKGARRYVERALAINQATLGPDHPDVAHDRANLGSVFDTLGRPDEARLQYEQALAIFEAKLGPHHPRTQQLRDALGGLLNREAPAPDDPP